MKVLRKILEDIPVEFDDFDFDIYKYGKGEYAIGLDEVLDKPSILKGRQRIEISVGGFPETVDDDYYEAKLLKEMDQ